MTNGLRVGHRGVQTTPTLNVYFPCGFESIFIVTVRPCRGRGFIRIAVEVVPEVAEVGTIVLEKVVANDVEGRGGRRWVGGHGVA